MKYQLRLGGQVNVSLSGKKCGYCSGSRAHHPSDQRAFAASG
jgi:hypothetical protein